MMTMQNPPRNGEGDRAKRGGGGSPSLRRPEVYAARRLRKAMSLPEVLIWNLLRANSDGVRFRRQHPIGPYIADFYCASARLAIEIDGQAHDQGDRPGRDAVRDAYFQAKGLQTVRIPAADILKDAAEVAAAIVRMASPLRQSLRDCHLPMNGEDMR